ncbi:uncharacterized protein LOC122256245 [Penaeus japonicus]|uniref:uncharacterized protein LOC122256245 n=1 Tax=Penaeus japonicus TaxID=27405 RepID=UPI001C711028|nr:uncharacterized protein LOC122256245 [Penaeus japonicus]
MSSTTTRFAPREGAAPYTVQLQGRVCHLFATNSRARKVDQSCMDSIQCNARTNNSGCAIASPNITGVCACDTHFWAYNASLCVHQTSLDSMTWTWIHKKIVNDMCSVTFTVRSSDALRLKLGSYEDWRAAITNYYFILGGWSNTQSILKNRGTQVVTASTPQLMTNDFQNFTLHWCNGQIRVRLQGGNDFISWDDPSPFVVRTIGFHIPSHDNSHLFFPHNLVDPYFPTSVETGSYYHGWLPAEIMVPPLTAQNLSIIKTSAMPPRGQRSILDTLGPW